MSAGATTNEPERWFFVHLQKCGGTTLVRRLRVHFGDHGLFPDATDGDPVARVIDPTVLSRRFDARRTEIRVITGHFPLCVREVFDVPLRTMTVLREPVARTLSYLRHHRAGTPADRDRTLEEIYDDPFRFHGLIHNHMTKMFSLTVDEMDSGALTRVDFDRARLERACERLATVDEVGFQDDLDGFCADLATRYGWDLGRAHVSNASEPVPVDDAFRARIADDNADDIALYEFARRSAAGRAPAPTEEDEVEEGQPT